ncbi:MAG: GAF domain-containing protein [Chryseolinea sp.]
MKDSTTLKEFPFRSILNLRLLVEYWEKAIKAGEVPFGADQFTEYINNAPELREPIVDLSVLDKHRLFVNFLMTAVIPLSNNESERVAAILPFQFKSIYSTNVFKRTLDLEKLADQVTTNFPDNHMTLGKTVKACLLILKKFYDVKLNFEKPMLFTIRNKETGLDRVYKVDIDSQFCDIIPKAPLRPIEKHVIKFLMEKIYDTDLWMQYIKPEDFEFQGFMAIHLVDVTEQEMLSSIKYDLLEKNAVIRSESFNSIQQKLRSIFEIPEMKLGLAFLDPSNKMILSSGSSNCWRSLTNASLENQPCDDYTGSVYERSWMEKKYVTVENLREYPFPSKTEEKLLANGINNLLLAPLVDEGETIGMLELATGTPGKLNPIGAHRVENVLPMFTAAIKRVKEEMSTEVRALIQEECTAIHPSVQWRFFEAGVNLMNRRRVDEKAALEEIVFKDVYPLFGLADVRNSSLERNAAIQKDLQQNLKLVKDLLQRINSQKNLPIVEEVIFKTDEQLRKINAGLASGDESNVLEFLKSEIHPLLEHFEEDSTLGKFITRYRTHLDPVFGVVYKRRKLFEESLAMINKMIGDYIDEAETSAQEMFPHYFEKYKTDGFEFTLYLGTSLVKDKVFDAFYLKNFHLWQLMTMIEIDRRMDLLKPKLKNNLDITQLILVHDQPISIRFRADEKHFDVDGAYDIRYEIVKKRIDKAYIKNTGERLNQPGKIAIVYNQIKVEEEYRRFFHYLAGKKLIAAEIEELELEELPGANGLRALRITVIKADKQKTSAPGDDLLKDIEEALRLH